MGAILDFGCGCGRVARHWAALEGPEVYGSDYNRELIDWCRANLPFMAAATNGREPPFPFDRHFDLVYAISVFNHLTEATQLAWIAECRRVLHRGGLLLFTTLGERYLDYLDARERERFASGELVTQFDEVEGLNLCGAWHPEPFLDRMLKGFERIESIDRALDGVATDSPLRRQDVQLARRL
jgi:SAM-dependent methyltransferase